MAIFPGSAIPSGVAAYDIDQSLRFDAASDAFLHFTPSSPINAKTFTWSGWVKIGSTSVDGSLFGTDTANTSGRVSFNLIHYSDGRIGVRWVDGSGNVMGGLYPAALHRDPSAWFHVVLSVDTTADAAHNRLVLYINGVRFDVNSTPLSGYESIHIAPAKDAETYINNGRPLEIGAWTYPGFPTTSYEFDGYLSEVHFIDGQALTPDYFGVADETYGHWKPIEFDVTTTPKASYGTNGFYLPFSGTEVAAILDSSSNGWAVTSAGAVHSTTQKKIGTSSIDLGSSFSDGIYFTIPDNGSLQVGTGDFTWESWVYWPSYGSGALMAHGGSGVGSNSTGWGITTNTDGTFEMHSEPSGTRFKTTSAIPTNQWVHIALVRNSGTAKWYINGTEDNSTSESSNLSSISYDMIVGRIWDSTTFNFGGYVDEIRFSDTARYTSGFTPSTTQFTSDANTLVLIHSNYSPTTSIGADSSGNLNTWTPNNLSASDVVLDSPTNNFATWNAVDHSTGNAVTSEGNLKFSVSSAGQSGIRGNFLIPRSGKWYWEAYLLTNSGGSPAFGVCNTKVFGVDYADADGLFCFRPVGNDSFRPYFVIDSSDPYGSAISSSALGAGDIVQILWDVDNGYGYIGINNTFYGLNGTTPISVNASQIAAGTYAAYSVPSDEDWVPYIHGYNATDFAVANFGQDSSFAGNKTAQNNTDSNGYGDFYYAPPSGFLALCTKNLPEPAVVPAEHFNTVLYAGTGSVQAISVGWKPDAVWIKSRSDAEPHNLFDAVRGDQQRLLPNLTNAESTISTSLTNFDVGGFTVSGHDHTNKAGATYVAWNWKADNTSGSSNTDGSITSTVAANVDAGFSIVSYTGTGSAATVGHGLSSAPDLIIGKKRSSTGRWLVYHSSNTSAPETDYLTLETTEATTDNANIWNDTAPTSTVFSLGSDGNINSSGATNIAYCFHSVDGYSKFGSYTGNGSSDGPFVYTGFRPAYVMVKRTDTVSHWQVHDTARDPDNVMEYQLHYNENAVDGASSAYYIDTLSNGFKLRMSHAGQNASGGTYIYMAFAEYPFKYSNARGSSYDKYTNPADAAVTVAQSLRFEDGSSAYLSRTPSATSNQKTFTWAGWVKEGNTDSYNTLFSAGNSGSAYCSWWFNNGKLVVFSYNGGTLLSLTTTAIYRDPSAWYHVVVAFDTTHATSSERIKVYVNGERVTTFDSATYPTQNLATYVNAASTAHYVGWSEGGVDYWDGYMADVYFIDGQALGPEHFGYKDATYGDWRPKAYADGNPEADYGSNGFHLDFQAGAIGTDRSPMGNNWTANNLANSDVVQDSPTNNFATYNPLSKNASYPGTSSEGNLKQYVGGAASTFAMQSGKWYWEMEFVDVGTFSLTGIMDSTRANTGDVAGLAYPNKGVAYVSSTGYVWKDGSQVASYATWTTGDIIGMSYDQSTQSITFYKNGTSQGSITATSPDGSYVPYTAHPAGTGTSVANFGQDSSFAGNKTRQSNTDDNGYGDFYYSPPTGFLALCTANLPESAVVPGENFNTVLYTGSGITSGQTRSISGMGFQPDFLWFIRRDFGGAGYYYRYVFDKLSGTGATKGLRTDSTSGEGMANQSYDYLNSFDSDGFTLGATTYGSFYLDSNGASEVVWGMKGSNTSGSTNNNGSITSTVSANQDAGFSIVNYTGNSGPDTIGHGLTQAPEIIILKNKSASGQEWVVYPGVSGISSPETKYLRLDSTGSLASTSTFWNNTAPTNQVFSVGDVQPVNGAWGNDYVAYCWHAISGFSKFGTYTGNGSTDGTFVYTGFRPKWIMVKRTDGDPVYAWLILDTERDPYNVSEKTLFPHTSAAENTSLFDLDILSNGFKWRSVQTSENASGGTYIYMAFAEYPFKRSNAR